MVIDLSARRLGYVAFADGAAGGSEPLDLLTILAGTAGVASAAFSLGASNDLAPSAGTLATGAFGLRSYYNAGARYPVWVSAARALSCLEGQALALRDEGFTAAYAEWTTFQIDQAPENLRPEIERRRRLLGSVLAKLRAGATGIDDQVMARLSVSASPNLSTYYQNYVSAVQQGERQQQESEEAVDTAQDTAAELTAQVIAFQRMSNEEKAASGVQLALLIAEQQAAERLAERLATSLPLMEMVSELDGHIAECVALAA